METEESALSTTSNCGLLPFFFFFWSEERCICLRFNLYTQNKGGGAAWASLIKNYCVRAPKYYSTVFASSIQSTFIKLKNWNKQKLQVRSGGFHIHSLRHLPPLNVHAKDNFAYSYVYTLHYNNLSH